MTDKYTIVVYLKSSNDEMELPRFPADVKWNNKKWRCLFFFDDQHQIVWAGRQYPFYNKSVLYTIADIMSEKERSWKYFDTNWDKDYWWTISTFKSDCFRSLWKRKDDRTDDTRYEFEKVMMYYNGDMCAVMDLIDNGDDSMQYNDLISSTTYVPDFLIYGCYHNLAWMKHQHKMHVGAAAPCIWCGENPIGYSDIMLCPDCLKQSDMECDYVYHCDRCGKRMLEEEVFHQDGCDYCEHCYHELFD